MNGGFANRREKFFQGTHADPANEVGMQAALLILRSEIERLASANGLPQVSEADMSRMLAAGQQHLQGQGATALQHFRPGSAIVTQLAQQAFTGTLGTPSQATLVALKQQQSQAGDGVGVIPGEKPVAGQLRNTDALLGRNGNGRSYSEISTTTGSAAASLSGSYAKAYAGMGYDAATVNAFADVGLTRSFHDELRRDGFSKGSIERGAKGVKALGLKGRGAVRDGVLIEEHDKGWLEDKAKPYHDEWKNETDPAKREEIEKRFYREEVMPETNPEVRDAKGRMWERIFGKSLDATQKAKLEQGVEVGRESSRAQTDQQRIEVSSDPKMDRKEADRAMATGTSVAEAQRGAVADDGFGVTVSSAAETKKPEVSEPSKPVKAAEAKPASKPAPSPA